MDLILIYSGMDFAIPDPIVLSIHLGVVGREVAIDWSEEV